MIHIHHPVFTFVYFHQFHNYYGFVSSKIKCYLFPNQTRCPFFFAIHKNCYYIGISISNCPFRKSAVYNIPQTLNFPSFVHPG